MLFDPAEANHFSPIRIDLYCFPSKLERQPSKCQNFEAQSHSLFSRCLRLATTITGSHPRLATGGWLDLTRQAFHLLDYSPLSGRTIPIHHIRVRSIRPCSFPLKWRSALTKFPIGTPRPQTNVSASLHLSHSTIISVPAPISTIHIISINVKLMLLSFQS